VAAWSNAAAAIAAGAGATYVAWSRMSTHAIAVGAATGVVMFALLRFFLVHRVSVWIAAALGTLTVGALGGSLAWVFAHVIEQPEAPSIAAVMGALLAAAPPAWSYAHLARRRREEIPDSLLDPVSIPRSR
jgi:hypothetical protein